MGTAYQEPLDDQGVLVVTVRPMVLPAGEPHRDTAVHELVQEQDDAGVDDDLGPRTKWAVREETGARW